jgi:hypothetical protein
VETKAPGIPRKRHHARVQRVDGDRFDPDLFRAARIRLFMPSSQDFRVFAMSFHIFPLHPALSLRKAGVTYLNKKSCQVGFI